VLVCLLQLFSCGSAAQTVLSRNTLGEPLTVHIGFSVGLAMASYVAGGISGKYTVYTVHTVYIYIYIHKHIGSISSRKYIAFDEL